MVVISHSRLRRRPKVTDHFHCRQLHPVHLRKSTKAFEAIDRQVMATIAVSHKATLTALSLLGDYAKN